MLPTLNFFGNHALDFENSNMDDLKYRTISKLRKIPTPATIQQIVYTSLRSQFPGDNLSKFTDMENWSPVSFPGISSSLQKNIDEHIVAFGPLAMRIVFTAHHIILPSIIYQRIDWYSPTNREKIQAIRFYYHQIINHFGGDHALYVDEHITDKYNFPLQISNGSALNVFEQSLIEHYGKTEKTLFDYTHGKYPKYYIDTFNDIK